MFYERDLIYIRFTMNNKSFAGCKDLNETSIENIESKKYLPDSSEKKTSKEILPLLREGLTNPKVV